MTGVPFSFLWLPTLIDLLFPSFIFRSEMPLLFHHDHPHLTDSFSLQNFIDENLSLNPSLYVFLTVYHTLRTTFKFNNRNYRGLYADMLQKVVPSSLVHVHVPSPNSD